MSIAKEKVRHRINHNIKAKEVRLIGSEGEQLGVMPLEKALSLARDNGFDLVQVTDKANPVVCRIMDYGKYKYKQKKRESKAKKNQKLISVKHIRLGLNIEDHDLQIKLKKAIEFIEDNKQVQFSVMFKGRQIAHKELGFELFNKVISRLETVATVLAPPKMEGKRLLMTLKGKATK